MKKTMSTGTAPAPTTSEGNASADAAKADRTLKLAKKALDAHKDSPSRVLKIVGKLIADNPSGPVFDLATVTKGQVLTNGKTQLAAAKIAKDKETLKTLAKNFKDLDIGTEAATARTEILEAEKKAKDEKRAQDVKDKEAEKAQPPEPVPAYGQGIAEYVSIEAIDLPPKGMKVREFDPESDTFKNKVEFIRTNPTFLQPILLRPSSTAGRFILVDGRNRWEACKLVQAEGKLDRSKIEAKVFKDLDAAQGLEIGLQANIQSERMSKTEIGQALGVLIGKTGDALSLRQFAARQNMNVNTLRNLLSLNKLTTDAQRAVAKGEIKAAKAYALGRVPIESQKDWIESAKTMPTGKFVKAIEELLASSGDDGPDADTSSAAAAAAVTAKTHLSPKKMAELLEEVCSEDPKAGPGKINDAFQAGMAAGIRSCLGWSVKYGTVSNVGYVTQVKKEIKTAK